MESFAWALGVMAMSWVMNEKWGYFLGAGLFFIWNMWEYGEYKNPNYIFILVPLLVGYLFYRSSSITGIAVSIFFFFVWFYQINVFWIERAPSEQSDMAAAVFTLLHIAFGILQLLLAYRFENNEILFIPSKIITVTGWIAVFIPFIVLSWPIEFSVYYLLFQEGTLFHTVEYLFILVLSGGLIYIFKDYIFERDLIVGIWISALLYAALPMGHLSTSMVALHLGLFTLLFGMLYYHYRRDEARSIERFLSIFIFIFFIAIKGFGLLGLAITNSSFFYRLCSRFCHLLYSCIVDQSDCTDNY